jgi:hypothetical protein
MYEVYWGGRLALRNLVQDRTFAESGAGQNFSFPSPAGSDFEFEDEDIGNRDSSDPSHREEGTSAARSMSPMMEAS